MNLCNKQNTYSQHFIFFLTYKLTNKLVLHFIRLERLAVDKHSGLLGQLISYDENEIWKIRSLHILDRIIPVQIASELEFTHLIWGRNDIQHNDTQHNDTQHNDTQNNNALLLCWVSLCDTQNNDTHHNRRALLCWVSFMLSFMLSVTQKLLIQSVVMLSVVSPITLG
jgi:hypothetical protein